MSMPGEPTSVLRSVATAQRADQAGRRKTAGGYCDPPVHTRFKPKQSGNPSGRPRGKQSLKSILTRVLEEKIEVRDGKKTRTMSKYEAMLQSLSLKAIQGDTRAASFIQALAHTTGLFADIEEDNRMLSKEDAAILNDYVHQQAEALEAESKSGLH